MLHLKPFMCFTGSLLKLQTSVANSNIPYPIEIAELYKLFQAKASELEGEREFISK